MMPNSRYIQTFDRSEGDTLSLRRRGLRNGGSFGSLFEKHLVARRRERRSKYLIAAMAREGYAHAQSQDGRGSKQGI